MTPAELKTLIESDAEALALARSGAADLCAKRCMVIAPKVRAKRRLTRIGLYDEIGMALAIPILKKLEAYAASDGEYAYGVADFLSFLVPANGGADFSNADLLAVANGFLQAGVFSQQEFDAINSISLVPPTITGADVSTAYPFPPQD